jgi:hypothetical protein
LDQNYALPQSPRGQFLLHQDGRIVKWNLVAEQLHEGIECCPHVRQGGLPVANKAT